MIRLLLMGKNLNPLGTPVCVFWGGFIPLRESDSWEHFLVIQIRTTVLYTDGSFLPLVWYCTSKAGEEQAGGVSFFE